ncbi:ubiquitin-conjugating enzyme/RWD-like protein [Emericellopsis atlantica]|uniref:E2 ubiquitin-conjugating enzyme n=1 Tax=Emericellopsis atlantica TaxID=2614577 RepID=A0A9P7ZLZ1_9HYPO|nr:ubiquitin-conjugating enzyme/RWD-like protein [Emericellopsis atlantica]KAG9254455.1 ubiquitin-conjugating enzyme/RWD-like protein [Emericellopsis atlantica]
MSTKRLAKEHAELDANPPEGFTIRLPPSQSLHTWHIIHRPPPESALHPGQFGLVLSLPPDYPFKPPTLKFVTRVYHPNVTDDSLGNVCLGILKSENWKPSTKISAVLDAVRNLMIEPQPDDPLEERIAEEYRRDRPAWEEKAKAYVAKYAMDEPEFPASAS